MSNEFKDKKYTLHPVISAKNETLTLRDQFAMSAMQGILSNHAMIDTSTDQTLEWVAKNAYQMADAMLKARYKQP
ncbi:TPA: hypothetical protein ACXJTA_000130 [Proteus mirabilis]